MLVAASVSSFCYHLSGRACEKCQKFLVLGENLPSNLKSTNFGSVFARFDGNLTSEFKIKFFFLSSFCYPLLGKACEKFKKLLKFRDIKFIMKKKKISSEYTSETSTPLY